jgi:putative tryptophan/tyrosine transport system substrate-binding protein
MIRRRTFIAGLGAAAAWPLAARAQQGDRVRRIGVLMNGVETDPVQKAYLAAFVQGLRNLGWVDGQTARLDIRWNADDAERPRAAAGELLGLSPDVILSATTPNLTALLRQAPAMPIVFVLVSDPVAQGFVSNLARPSGNITGFLSYEFSIGSKWVDLLKQVVPGLRRVTVVFNPDTSQQNNFLLAALEKDAPSLGVEVAAARIHDDAGLERAVEEAAQRPNGGIIFPTDNFLQVHRAAMIELTARYRVPAISFERLFTEQGGLMSYGAEQESSFRQAAVYVDRILKGAKPSELPIQSPIRFSLVINMKTARALGIEVPTNLLLIADDYIQ